jgi:hypothetical protein
MNLINGFIAHIAQCSNNEKYSQNSNEAYLINEMKNA